MKLLKVTNIAFFIASFDHTWPTKRNWRRSKLGNTWKRTSIGWFVNFEQKFHILLIKWAGYKTFSRFPFYSQPHRPGIQIGTWLKGINLCASTATARNETRVKMSLRLFWLNSDHCSGQDRCNVKKMNHVWPLFSPHRPFHGRGWMEAEIKTSLES